MLISKGVYCPVHWSISKHHILTNRTREIYEKVVEVKNEERYLLQCILRKTV